MKRIFLSVAALLLISSTALAGPLGIFGGQRGSSQSSPRYSSQSGGCANGACESPQAQFRQQPSFTQPQYALPQTQYGFQGNDAHTHTDSNGHTWGGSPGHDHNCPECGEFQDRQDAFPRQVNVWPKTTTSRGVTRTYTVPSTVVQQEPATFAVPEGFELVPKGKVKATGSPEETLTKEQMPKKLTINGVDYYRH